MDNTSKYFNLGRAIINPTSLNKDIEKHISDLLNYLNEHKKIILESLYPDCNEIEKKLWDEILNNKNFLFPVNLHILSFIDHHKPNLKLIFKYLNFRYFFFLVSEKKLNTDYPPYLLIEPVSTCNLRCPFCFQTDKTFTKKPFMGVMDFEFFKKIVDEADNLGVGAVTLASRGEPTLHKNLKDMLKYLNTKKNIFEKKLNTNATFLTEDLCYEIFNSKVNQVIISADHYEKKTFEELRKNSNFEKVVKNVEMLFEIRKKIKNPLTEIRVSGIDYYKSTDKEKFKNFWLKRSDHVTIGNALERWDTYNNSEHPEINDPCEYLWDRMYIWFDGKVNPCDADYKSMLSYGSAKENSIKDLWNNKIIKKII